jgi:hypothetical protein
VKKVLIFFKEGSEEENQLKLMMNGEFDSRVTFTLLTDPGEDDDGSVDCEDVATAEINLRDCKFNSTITNLQTI